MDVDRHHSARTRARGSPVEGSTRTGSNVLLGIRDAIESSLCSCIYDDAIFYAERLYELDRSHRSLHILANCYRRSGDAGSACRLLQTCYPFFEPNACQPEAASSPQERRTSLRVAAGAGRTATGAGLASVRQPLSSSAPYAGQRTAQRRTEHDDDGGGGGDVWSEPTGLAARWDCQYLFGVCCADTGSYAEGMRVLEELLRVSQYIAAEQDGKENESAASSAEQQQQLKVLGSCTAGYPRYYAQRRGEVQYWLGVCAKRHDGNRAPGLLREAVADNPLLFSAFESCVKMSWKPERSECLQAYEYAGSYPFAQAAVKKEEAVALSPPPTRESQVAARLNAVRRFLVPYARSSFFLHTFSCPDAQRSLQPGNFCEDADDTGAFASSPWRLSRYAMSLFHYGDMQGCVAAFSDLLHVAPWRLNDSALIYCSTALWQLRSQSELSTLAQCLTEYMPMSPITLCVVANTYSLAKESKSAMAMLDRAVQVDKTLAYAHTLRGHELLSLGMSKEARDAFHKAINEDHNMYMAYAGLGEQQVREEHVERARQYFKQAIALNPLPAIMNRYAATYHRQGATRSDLTLAISIYNEAIQRNPSNLIARHQRADVMMSLGRATEAAADLLSMARVHPNEAMLFVTLARCEEALGHTEEAVKYYHRARSLDPRRESFIRSCLERLSAAADNDGDGSLNFTT